MAALRIKVQSKMHRPREMIIELNADQFERVAGTFGLWNPDFLRSIDRAENDVRAGRVKKIRSLKDLRT